MSIGQALPLPENVRRAIDVRRKLGFNGGMVEILVATRNQHKVIEIQEMLGREFKCHTLSEFRGVPEIIEDASSFAGNAQKKAEGIAHWLMGQSGHSVRYVLADDSGLEVDALGGAPGVYSARFAALDSGTSGNSSDADNNAKLLRLLQNVEPAKRKARFRCAIVVMSVCQSSERAKWLFEGVCGGRIDDHPRGRGGFGYDPLFIPDGYEVSFAELGESVKNQISHRAQAMARLRDAWSHGVLKDADRLND